jgi:ribosomal protein S27E|tara:strand:- start:268 stop:474 length:207 start_codon:yes stop_codon:yes gene_type:complete
MKMFNTEIVSGRCPECHANTLLVGIANSYYRCSNCGEDLEQKVNGVIKYIVADKDTKIALRTDIADDG